MGSRISHFVRICLALSHLFMASLSFAQTTASGSLIPAVRENSPDAALQSILDANDEMLKSIRQYYLEQTPNSSATSSQATYPQDSLALVALYDSTDGDFWANKTGWLNGPVSTWYGVTTTSGRVTKLVLDDNNLTGRLPAQIGYLDSLHILDLERNNISGPLPPSMGLLRALTFLALYNNDISGPIIPELCNMSRLEFLDLRSNKLTGRIPSEIGNLVRLKNLQLGINIGIFGTIPPELCSLGNLEYLDLSVTSLSGAIPSEIGNLINLQQIYLQFNNLTGSIPPEIGSLKKLTLIWFKDMALTGSIPPEIGLCESLQFLIIMNTEISGPIPSELGDLSNLISLLVNTNQLSGAVPSSLTGLPLLKDLDLFENNLVDLPDLSSITTFEYVSVQRNKFTFEDIEPNISLPNFTYAPQDSVGTVRDTTLYEGLPLTIGISVGGTQNMYQWYKDGNSLDNAQTDHYTIPSVSFSDSGSYSCIIRNTLATELALYSRPFHLHIDFTPHQKDSLALLAIYDSTGGPQWQTRTNWRTDQPISTWHGITMTGDRVAKLDLGSNNLSGTLPDAIGDLTELDRLYLNANNLTGAIPSSIGNLKKLLSFTLSLNQLSGSIPKEIGDMSSLRSIHLGYNKISGALPNEVGNLKELAGLYLNFNELSGSLPTSMGNMSGLRWIDLNKNQCTGSIPSQLGDLPILEKLDLSENAFIGSIPSELGNVETLEELLLYKNQLTGSIPADLGQLPNLFNLNLSENQLTGALPPEIGNLPALTRLILHSNQLSDTIPSELGNLGLLQNLQLHNNMFEGPIPSSFWKLSNLLNLTLNNNRLTGNIPISFGNLYNLQFLDIQDNKLSGVLPSTIGGLVNVVYLSLRNNMISGAVPGEITSMLNLESLYLDHNRILDLPSLEGLDSLRNLSTENNRLTFEDLEPNVTIPSESFTYAPQDTIGAVMDTILNLGEPVTLSVTVSGQHNIYAWYRNDSLIPGAVSPVFSIDAFDENKAGVYECRISNTVATQLTLVSHPMTLRLSSPPPAPTGLTVSGQSPSPWQRDPVFQVNWTNPTHKFPLKGVFYKLDDPPESNYDTTGSHMGKQPATITAIKENGQMVYLWLVDDYGNVDFHNYSTLVLRLDRTIPEFTGLTPVYEHAINEDIEIAFSVADQYSGVKRKVLYFRKTGDVFAHDSVKVSGPAGVIPDSINTQRGVEYALGVTDSAGNVARLPEAGYFSIQANLPESGTTQPLAQVSGKDVSAYRIFSVPFLLQDQTPAGIFEDDLGTFDDTRWKLFDVSDESLIPYPDIRDNNIVYPGKGLLLIMTTQKKITVGKGQSVNPDFYRQMDLADGWNLIGNPFDFDIPVNNLSVNGKIPEAWYFDGSWRNDMGSLKRWEGLAIFSEGQSVLHIGVESGAPYSANVMDGFQGQNWGMRITATGETSSDPCNFIGVYHPDSSLKRTVWHEPFTFGDAVSLYMTSAGDQMNKMVGSSGTHYSTLLQTSNADGGNLWDLTIEGSHAGEIIHLRFEHFARIPEDREQVLLDPKLKIAYDLASGSDIEIKMDASLVYQLRLIVGEQGYIDTYSEGIPLLPSDVQLRQNFPNPFNSTTAIVFSLPEPGTVTLEMYNTMGQKIRTLAKNQSYGKGFHLLHWDGKNDQQNPLPSGLYLLRMKSGTFIQTRKLVLLQ